MLKPIEKPNTLQFSTVTAVKDFMAIPEYGIPPGMLGVPVIEKPAQFKVIALAPIINPGPEQVTLPVIVVLVVIV